MKEKIKLSIIVPTLNQETITLFIKSIAVIKRRDIELVIVNQTGRELDANIRDELNISFVDKRVNKMPAAEARNFGAEFASGDYLFFLDDDAFFYSDLMAIEKLLLILDEKNDLIIVQRGEVVDGIYVSHWPQKINKINHKNFPRVIIEWNVIIRKDIFFKIGGFPNIGVGSQHAASSGEVFVLFAKTMLQKCSTCLFPDIKIVHPNLFNTPKNIASVLGYSYGNGYAIGLSLPYFNKKQKIYWILRMFGAACKDILLMECQDNIGKDSYITQIKYRFSSIKCKLYGFFDCIYKQKPRDISWLEEESISLIRDKK